MRLSSISLNLLYGSHLKTKKSSVQKLNSTIAINIQEYIGPVLIFVNQATSKDLEFWNKVMQACKFNSSKDYNVIMLKNQIPIFNSNDFKLQKICLLCSLSKIQLLSFGIKNNEFYIEQKVQNLRLLIVPDSNLLQINQTEKRMLWNSLKKLFAIF